MGMGTMMTCFLFFHMSKHTAMHDRIPIAFSFCTHHPLKYVKRRFFDTDRFFHMHDIFFVLDTHITAKKKEL
jgi:hypothetical protein